MKMQKPTKRDSRAGARRSKAPASEAPATGAEPVEQPIVVDGADAPAGEPAAAVREASSQIVVLAASCTVREAAALKDELCAAADRENTQLDASAVERIDTAALQLLCAFVKRCDSRNRPVEWIGTSTGFDEAARLLGIAKLLHLPHDGGQAGDEGVDSSVDRMGAAA